MQITDKQIDKFIEIYRKNFGTTLDRDSAYKKGLKLAEAMQLILKENAKHREKVQFVDVQKERMEQPY